MTDKNAVAQQIWQVYAAETGQALPAGIADLLADAAIEAMNHKAVEQAKPATPVRRGTRLPPEWTPANTSVNAIRDEFPGATSADLLAQHKVFGDYWAGVPGQRGVKLDWNATWRNWMRKAFAEQSYQRGNGTSKVDRKVNDWVEAGDRLSDR